MEYNTYKSEYLSKIFRYTTYKSEYLIKILNIIPIQERI